MSARFLFSLCIALACVDAAASDTTAKSEENDARDEQRASKAREGDDDDGDDEPSYMERFSPFSIDRGLDPIVDDNLFVFFASGALFCVGGNVWLPALLVGDPPDGYWTDASVAWLLHVLGIVVVGVALSAASVILQPLAAAVGPLMLVFVLVNAFYLMPVASINAYNRGLAPRAPPRRERRPASDDEEAPAWMKDAPPPRMEESAPPAAPPPADPAPSTDDPSEAPDEILRY